MSLLSFIANQELSFARGELVYRRDTSFDEAIDVLFPELGEHLSSPFGTDLMNDEGAG